MTGAKRLVHVVPRYLAHSDVVAPQLLVHVTADVPHAPAHDLSALAVSVRVFFAP